MPKTTFFHLSEEKQRRLLNAAKNEFSRTSLKEASIANVVKLAEIPRGSFYQYFENKEDLYYYYFELLRQDSKKDIEKCIQKAEGNLFEGIKIYFSKIIFEVLTGEHALFYKNFFMNMDDQSTSRVSPRFITSNKKGAEHQKKRHGHQIYARIDLTQLKINNELEFKMLMQMIMNSIFSSITEGYRQLEKDSEYDIQELINNFKVKLNWLENGVSK
ncbi:TetR/AcrR family transcriptional regulator [Candidatus Enterococcus ikei]|uniref:TetR family transcriptional regulator n=1 Tax=Candidatus Enterococcus ikei TaxID=2815326 RepID=A0ABS3GWC3_9ENTE|nr:TetR/AcrR family transcriptional regulator [Enterococcus sp. DIV0869a]MBO0439537.1 TetR family transcriptional regulator [Enterococcus sp. DIV0869a]